jgi:LysM repeat protein
VPTGYHRRVSERTADPQVVCPFVAFDDDRDFRSPVPDHRHRCFAESPAAPRALAHQAAYCLSSAFPGCPTFMDWARREAAPPKAESPIRSPRDPASTPRPSTAPKAAGAAAISAASPPGEPAPRRSESDWAAPPPWAPGVAGTAGAVAAAGGTGQAADVGAVADAGLAGSGFEPAEPGAGEHEPVTERDSLAAVGRDVVPPAPDLDESAAEAAAPPAFLAGRSRQPAAAPPEWNEREPWDQEGVEPAADRDADDRYADDRYADDRYAPPGRRPVAEPRRVPIGYAPVPPAKGGRRTAGSHERHDPAAPTWEEPRRFEAYPTLKSRGGGGIPRPAIYALIVLVAGIALFATPFLLRGLGGGGEQASPTPAASASAGPTVAPSPTPVPTPAQVVHVVKAGDTLSKIAATYGVTVDQILAANPKIKDPNKIAVGDEIVIPQPLPTEIVDGEITPAP